MEGKLRNMTSIYISRSILREESMEMENPVSGGEMQEQMLMLYRVGSRVVAPSWCGIGGHFEPEELNQAQKAALRELEEEMSLTGEDLQNLRLRYVTLRLKNGEIRQNYYFFADLKPGTQVKESCAEGIPRWISYEEVMKQKMPYTARFVLQHYLEKARYDQTLYAGIAGPEGVEFRPLVEFA